MELDAGSENSALVLPVKTFERYCRQTMTQEDLAWDGHDAIRGEVQLIRPPETLQAFCELPEEVIWMGDTDSFASYRYLSTKGSKTGYQCYLDWSLTRRKLGSDIDYKLLYIHAFTREKAVDGLNYLFALTDNYFTESSLDGNNLDQDQSGFQLPCSFFKNMIMQNQKRTHSFSCMYFTEVQSRVFATCGTRTSLAFIHCIFQDRGVAFMEDYLAPGNHAFGPSKLSLEEFPVFAGFTLIPCLKKLETLKFLHAPVISADICRAVAAAPLEFLSLGNNYTSTGGPRLRLEDAGEALIDSILRGRGPKGLRLSVNSFDAPGVFLRFCHALRSPLQAGGYLNRLELNKIEGSIAQEAVLAVLQEYRGLTRLGLSRFTTTEDFWLSLLGTLWNYSSLQILSIKWVQVEGTRLPGSRAAQVASVILPSKRIERLDFQEPGDFGRYPSLWVPLVQAMLDHNKYRERFAAVQELGAGRGAILAEALGTVEAKPSLLYALLQQNCDVILNCRRH